jgi:two-component system, NarL family, nitrate/nitrite response regulator NarL
MIRVLIADSHPVVREGLGVILATEPGIALVGQAQDGVEALDMIASADPDVMLMELNLPRLNGLGVLRSLAMRSARVRVVLFTGSDSKEEFVEAMKLGCAGILLKNSAAPLIAKSIQKVSEGEIWLDANTTAAVIRQFSAPPDFVSPPPGSGKSPRDRAQLSQREREIIVLIAQGYKNKEIAEKMFITEQTVKNHLHNIFDKLGVSDRLELALFAIHNSLHLKA